MLSYDHQGGWGWGWGGVLTFLTSTSFTLRKMLTCCRMIIGGVGVGGGGGVLTFLTSTSFRLRKMHMLHMLSYDHQGAGLGGGLLTFLTSTSVTLRNTLPLLTCCTVWRAFCGFLAWTYFGRGRILFVCDQGWNPQLCLDHDGSLHTSAEDVGKESAAGFEFVVFSWFINVDTKCICDH